MRDGIWPKLKPWIAPGCWTAAWAIGWEEEGGRIPFYARCILVPTLLTLATVCVWDQIKFGVDAFFHKPSPVFGAEQKSRNHLALGIFGSIVLVNVAAVFLSGYQFAMHIREAPTEVLAKLAKAESDRDKFKSAWDEAVDERNAWNQKYDRDSALWRDERVYLQEQIAKLSRDNEEQSRSLVEASNVIDDRTKREALRDKLGDWLVRVEEFRRSLRREEDGQVPEAEFQQLTRDLVTALKEDLRPAQLRLLDSPAAIDYGLSHIAVKNDRVKQMWFALFRWEVRLQQFMEETY